MKELYWKLMAQCLAGTLGGMTGGVIGFFVGIAIGPNYETGGVYGAIAGIIIGSIIGTLFFMKLKIESYKNISITELFVAMMIVITAIASRYFVPMIENGPLEENAQFSILHITTAVMTMFMTISLVPSLILTLYIHFYNRKHS